MPTLSPVITTTARLLGSVTRNTPTTPTPTPPDEVTEWELRAVTQAGTQTAVFPTFKPGPIIEGICVPEQATFYVPVDAADVDQLALDIDREVQIYRNGHLVFWGKPRTRRCSSDGNVWTYNAAGVLSYFNSRYFGEANRHNYLKNGHFDPGIANWTDLSGGDVVATHDTTTYLEDGGSMRLEISDSSSPLDSYTQGFSIATGSIGLALIFTGWFKISEFDAPGAGVQFFANARTQYRFDFHIDETTPRESWQLVSGAVLLPPNITDSMFVRLGGPQGVINWDAVSVTIQESVSLVNANSPLDGDGNHVGWEQEEIALFVFAYLSGQRPVGPGSYTKSRLNIGRAKQLPSSGIVKERTYQFADHQPGYQSASGQGALDEWPNVTNGFDYRVDTTPTSKVFRTYYPQLGEDRSALGPFSFVRKVDVDTGDIVGSYFGVVAYTDWGETIEGAASDITEMGGWGTGSGREEGGFSDPTAFGGPTFELVESAPTGAPIDLLDGLAAQRGAQLARVLKTPVLTIAEPRDPTTNEVTTPLIGVLRAGDFIAVRVDNFSVQLADLDDPTAPAVVRIAQITIDPDTDTLQVAIVPPVPSS